MKRIAFVAVLAAFAVGCASTPTLPPKASGDDVEVFRVNSGVDPAAGYRVIGPVRADFRMGTSEATVIAELRTRAARLGADAIIIQRIASSRQGAGADTDLEDDRLIGEALAIYWPAGSR